MILRYPSHDSAGKSKNKSETAWLINRYYSEPVANLDTMSHLYNLDIQIISQKLRTRLGYSRSVAKRCPILFLS